MRNDLKAAVDRLAENLRDAEETINDRTVHSMVQDEARKNIPAFNTALAALRDAMKRQPDPITGLVPCGCGGKAVIHDHQNYGEPGMNYWVGCDNQKCDCTVGMYLDETGQFEKKEDAIKAWNTAMGWKGDEK